MTSLSPPFSESVDSPSPRKACASLILGADPQLSSETKCLLCGRLKAAGTVITAGTALYFARALLIGDTTLLALHFLVLVEDQMASNIGSQIPMGRFGTSSEMAKAALFLASDDSSYVAGAELVADGGMTQI